jgi:phosphoribosyl 1,2-cyclic phosphodiesterase
MLTLLTISSGSVGNCHLIFSETETLILDCGVPIKEIEKGLNFNLLKVKAALLSHEHKDHSKALADLKLTGIPIFAPYESETIERKPRKYGEFTVYPLPMMDKDFKTWQHTNADRSECKCYGFYIKWREEKILYITDTKCIVWNFKEQKINHIILSVNYDTDLTDENDAKKAHVLTGHLSLQSAVKFVEVNYTDSLRSVIACHLSRENANKDKVIEEIKKVACGANVSVAEKGKMIELR